MQLALRTEHIPFSSLCAFFDAAAGCAVRRSTLRTRASTSRMEKGLAM